MKVIKGKKKEQQDLENRIRDALLALVTEAMLRDNIRAESNPKYPSAELIGRLASYMHRIFISKWFMVLLIAAFLYFCMRIAEISVSFYRKGVLIFSLN